MAEQSNERGSSMLAVKSGFWYVFSTFITKGLAFITTPIFARLMSSADYGEFTNFANWQSMLLIVISMELYGTLNRAFFDYKNEFDEYSSTITYLGLLTTVVAYIAFLGCTPWIYKVVSIPKEYTHLMFFTMLLQGCKQTFLAKERALYRYKKVAVISILSLLLPTLISILAVAVVPSDLRLSARMYGFYVPYALLGLYCGVCLLMDGKVFRKKYIKYAFALALPLLVHYLTTYLLTSTNTILTKSVLGAEAAAEVSIITSIMNILIMLFQAVTGAMSIWIMDNLEMGQIQKIKKCTVWFTLGSVLITVMVMLFGPEIVLILGGKKYLGGVDILPGMALSVFLQILTGLVTVILTYDKNLTQTAVVTGVAAVLSVGAKLWLLPTRGVAVLPIVNILTFAVVLSFSYWIMVKAGYGKCCNMKLTLVSCAVLGGLTYLCPILYSMPLIRYSALLLAMIVCGVGAYVKRDLWMPLVKKKLLKKIK